MYETLGIAGDSLSADTNVNAGQNTLRNHLNPSTLHTTLPTVIISLVLFSKQNQYLLNVRT